MKRNRVLLKATAFLIALTMLITPLSVSAVEPLQYTKAEMQYDMLPVIYVSGFGATTLAAEQPDGTMEPVFPPSMDSILDYLLDNIGGILWGIVSVLLFDNTDPLAAALSPMIVDMVDSIALTPDGTSKHENVVPIIEGAENTSLKAFTDSGMLAYVPYTGSEFLDMECVGDIIGDDKVFNFTYDWRRPHVDVAEDFREYVEDVLELTDAEKVNVYSISQGSLIVGAYLYKYAEDGYLNNIFFDTPALEGTDLVSRVFGIEDITLNVKPLAPLLSQILHTELDLSGILSILPVDFINFAFDWGRRELILPGTICGTAFWDMLPTSRLTELQEYWLDPTENAQVIAKTNELHYGFMANIRETFDKAEMNGAKITIKSGSGIEMIIGNEDNSDGIVNLKYSCGATCAPLGQKFADNYVQAKNGVYSISPDRTIDLSTAYYPERTWVIVNNVHGQAEWDTRSLDFILTQLMTKGVENAYSSYEFPQFMESMAPNDKLLFSFTSTNSSFLAYNNETGLFMGDAKITNISKEDTLYIKAVNSDYNTLRFVTSDKAIKLAPDESIQLDLVVAPGGKNITQMSFATVSIEYKTGLLGKAKTADFGITMIDANEYAGVVKQ